MKEPSLSALLAGDGWGPIQNVEGRIKEASAEAEARRLKMAEKVLALFETREGAEVMEWLLDRTLRKSSTPRIDQHNLLVTAEQLMPHTLFREGQNSIVADLVELMRAAKARRDKR